MFTFFILLLISMEIILPVRHLGGIDQWNEEFSNEVKKKIEKHWSSKVFPFRFDEKSENEKFYILSMFPYPSGSLHMGHIRVYSISDVLARFYRMMGKNVLHPMGWDGFGLPAEKAALERGVNPDDWTQENIANMKSLMEEMNFSFDWNREFATCDSDYYKWTQFFFLKLYESELVYRKEAIVNWDPVDQTVLADEQVDENNCSWRSGALVEKKMLKQWFVRTTRFAKDLLEGLNDPILQDWKDVIEIQKHWIGNVNGTTIKFQMVDDTCQNGKREISIWMNRPEYIDRAKFVAVKPNSLWTFGSSAEGLLPYRLKNPFTNDTLPVYVTEAVDYPTGADVCLGIPDLCEKHRNFANSVKIPFSTGLQEIANKDELLQLRKKICADALERGLGGYPTSSNLKDWLISRQRYWGTPIPIIHCENCGEQPVPENELPVLLPKVKSVKVGKNPLREQEDWLNVKCHKCGGKATREADTMDTFFDSSWYYLRFLDPDNEQAGFGIEKVTKMMPVDIYVGGKEHAALHLYFARFMNHFLHSVNLVPHREPFKRLLCQGMVKAKTFRSEKTGRYVKPESVEEKNETYFDKDTGENLILSWEKMSKSKYNGVEPKHLLEQYGVDTTRLAILSEASPHSHLEWDKKSFKGVLTWQNRLWLTVGDFIRIRSQNLSKPVESEKFQAMDFYLFDSRNFYLKKVTDLLDKQFNVSVAISKMQGLTNALRKANDDVVAFSLQYERSLALQIIMLAPIAPYFASELWAGFVKAPNRLCSTGEISWDVPVLYQEWPTLDEKYVLRSEEVMKMLKLSKRKSKAQRKQEKRLQKKAALGNADRVQSVNECDQ